MPPRAPCSRFGLTQMRARIACGLHSSTSSSATTPARPGTHHRRSQPPDTVLRKGQEEGGGGGILACLAEGAQGTRGTAHEAQTRPLRRCTALLRTLRTPHGTHTPHLHGCCAAHIRYAGLECQQHPVPSSPPVANGWEWGGWCEVVAGANSLPIRLLPSIAHHIAFPHRIKACLSPFPGPILSLQAPAQSAAATPAQVCALTL